MLHSFNKDFVVVVVVVVVIGDGRGGVLEDFFFLKEHFLQHHKAKIKFLLDKLNIMHRLSTSKSICLVYQCGQNFLALTKCSTPPPPPQKSNGSSPSHFFLCLFTIRSLR